MATPGLTQPKNVLRIVRGETKTLQLTVSDESGDPVDLTDGRVVFGVKRRVDDVGLILSKDSEKGVDEVELDDPRRGRAQIKLLAADTRRLDAKDYVYDVWVVLTSGARHPVIPPSVLEVVSGVVQIG